MAQTGHSCSYPFTEHACSKKLNFEVVDILFLFNAGINKICNIKHTTDIALGNEGLASVKNITFQDLGIKKYLTGF